MRHAFAALCAVLLAGAVAPPSQAATITVGSDLTGTVSADNGCEGQSCTRLLVSVNGVGQSSPVDGVVVRWRAVGQGHRAAATRAARHRRHLAGRAGERVRGVSHRKRAGRVATRLPIAAGDLLGVDAGVRSGVFVAARCNCPDPRFPGTATTAFWLPLLEDGQVRQPFATTTGLEALVNVDVESDADRDGFGDDTQDCAPADPAVHDTCGATPAPGPSRRRPPPLPPGATPPPPTTGPTPASPASPAPATPGAPASPPATAPRRTAARCRVPNLRGRTVAAARRALRARNCRLGAVTRVRARGVARGRVLSHRPRAGRVCPPARACTCASAADAPRRSRSARHEEECGRDRATARLGRLEAAARAVAQPPADDERRRSPAVQVQARNRIRART